jgi:hypothetical protein
MSYQLFDALPAHIEDALRASIERFGVLVPVVRDQHDNIIDGHHRARIADELGVEYRVDTVTVADEAEAREIARHLNSRRRHLSGEQLREHIVMLAERTTPSGVGELSQNEIAQVAGVSQPYVNKVLSDPELITSYKLPETRRGADGKVRPAHRPSPDTEPEPEPEHAAPDLLTGDDWVRPDADAPPHATTARTEPTETAQQIAAAVAEERAAAFDRAIADFPELEHYTDRPAKAVALADNLRQFAEPELSMRRENLAKSIAADQRRAEEPDEPQGPDYYGLADEIFVALNHAAQIVAKNGGPDTVRAAIAEGAPLMIETWREQFTDLAATCTTLADACAPRLRRLK